jgi:hypothetical protein
MRINHTNCAHENTAAARRRCRSMNTPAANDVIYGCDYCGGEKVSTAPIAYNHAKGCPATPRVVAVVEAPAECIDRFGTCLANVCACATRRNV